MLPILSWFSFGSLKEQSLFSAMRLDAGAGFAVAILLIPQCLAYAKMAGLSPVVGLYSAFPALLVYFLWGSSRELSIGPTAALSLLVFASGQAFQGVNHSNNTIVLSFQVGLILCFLAIFRLGFLFEYLSYPVLSGFLSSAALLIGMSQIFPFLGVSASGGSSKNLLGMLQNFATEIKNIHVLTALLGVLFLLLFLLLPKKLPKLWVPFLVTLIGLFCSWKWGFESHGIPVVGSIPKGLPSWQLPSFDWKQWMDLFPTALAIAFVGFIESISTAKALAKKGNYELENNRELGAIGVANVAVGMVGGFPITGSISRTAVNHHANAQSRFSSLFAAFFLVFSLFFFTSFLYYLPITLLASMIFVSIFRLFRFKEVVHFFRFERISYYEWLTTFVGCLVLGLEKGLFLGILFSLLRVIYETTQPKLAILEYVGTSNSFEVLPSFQASSEQAITMIRIENELPPGDCQELRDKIVGQLEKNPFTQFVIFDLSKITQITIESAFLFSYFVEECRKEKVEVLFANLHHSLLSLLLQSQNAMGQKPFLFFSSLQEARDYSKSLCLSPKQPDSPKGGPVVTKDNSSLAKTMDELTYEEKKAWDQKELGVHGVHEVNVEWLHQWKDHFRVIDIREEHELVSELGHIEGIEYIPMNEIPERMDEWSTEEPIVLLCRSGGRTLRMGYYLQQSGFSEVVSVSGGMIDWNSHHYPISRQEKKS